MRFPDPPNLPEKQGLFKIKTLIDTEREQSRLDQLWGKRLAIFFALLISAYLMALALYLSLRN